MRYLLLLTLILGVVLPITFEVSAQDTQSTATNNTKYVRLLLQNGGMFEGEVLEIDESSFLINTLMLGQMRITKTDIASITYISADEVGLMTSGVNTRSVDINPQATRYFFAPSAMQLKKGEGYYQNAWLIYNQVSYGFTDNLTCGLSMTPIGTGGTVKLGKQITEKVHVSLGGIGVLPFTDDFNTMGIGFANITFGDERRNFTLSYGQAFYSDREYNNNIDHISAYTDPDGEFHPSDASDGVGNWHYDSDGSYHPMFESDYVSEIVNYSTPLISIAGMIELNSRMWLITENYFVLDSDAELSIISIGIRKASTKRDVLWDFSMVAIPSEEVAGIPWVSCTIPF